MKIQIRNPPSYLKGLAETRARADADVLRLQKIYGEIAEKLAEAAAERDSCDCLILKYDDRLDPNRIAPIQSWKGRYESPRVLRRLQLLRRWSHEEIKQVFPRSARTRFAHGAGAPWRVSIAVGRH